MEALGQSSEPTEISTEDLMMNREKIEASREEKRRLAAKHKEEQDAALKSYSEKVRQADLQSTAGTNEWFTKNLNGMRRKSDILKVPYKKEDVRHWLAESYRMEVEMRGRDVEWTEVTKKGVDMASGWLTDDKLRWGLSLAGMPGIGKTIMAKSLRNVIKICLPNSEIMMVSALDLGGAGASKADIEKAKKVDVLIVDDLGLEPPTVKSYGNELSPMTDIIYHRYDNRQMTIVTTNLVVKWGKSGDKWVITEDPLLERYGSRIRDRFRDMFYTIDFGKIESYRKEVSDGR